MEILRAARLAVREREGELRPPGRHRAGRPVGSARDRLPPPAPLRASGLGGALCAGGASGRESGGTDKANPPTFTVVIFWALLLEYAADLLWLSPVCVCVCGVCVFVSVCACACRGRGRAETSCNFSL